MKVWKLVNAPMADSAAKIRPTMRPRLRSVPTHAGAASSLVARFISTVVIVSPDSRRVRLHRAVLFRWTRGIHFLFRSWTDHLRSACQPEHRRPNPYARVAGRECKLPQPSDH